MKRRTLFPFVAAFVLAATMVLSGVSAVTWSSDIRLTTDVNGDWDPSAMQANDGKIWVAWYSDRTGNHDIFYKIRSGSSWSGDVQLTDDPNDDVNPSILQAMDGKIWVVWDSDRLGSFNYEIYYKTSANSGASWSADTRLAFNSSRDSYPSIMQSTDGKIWVFWSSWRNVTVEPPDPTYVSTANIFYKVSSDSGQTWSDDTLIVTDYKNNYRYDLYPSCMQVANGSVWMMWTKQKEGQGGDIYYKIFNGTHWSSETTLVVVAGDDSRPSIMQTKNGRIWVFWHTDRNTKNDIYYKVFDGLWSGDIKFTTAIEDDDWPSAMQSSDLTIWVFWTSPRYPNLVYDIFYRTGMELHDVAVRAVWSSASHEAFAFRGEVAYVEVEVENQGEGMELVEVQCRANSTFLGSKVVTLNAGASYIATFGWNTTGARAGNYVLTGTVVPVLGEVDTADNTLSSGGFEIRIKGDICGWYGDVLMPVPDRRVNIDDFGMVVGHFGTASPTWNPVWGPACDVNEDGVIDLNDIMTVGVHYLET